MKNRTTKKTALGKVFAFILAVLAISIIVSACNNIDMSTNSEFDTSMHGGVGRETTSTNDESAKETLGEKNARKSAEAYVKMMGFSYSGLIAQLEYEGYSNDEATYGADNCGADWYAEATESAENYLDVMGMSRSELYAQLEYEGFTDDQIEHALTEVGY